MFSGEKPSEYGENEQQTRPTALGRNRPQATIVGGERYHHCAISELECDCETGSKDRRTRLHNKIKESPSDFLLSSPTERDL